MKKDLDVEIRSEKVRRLLGEMPRALEICGAVAMALILLGLVLVVCLVPYPYSGGESILQRILQITIKG